VALWQHPDDLVNACLQIRLLQAVLQSIDNAGLARARFAVQDDDITTGHRFFRGCLKN
jgi:hypothetical protein